MKCKICGIRKPRRYCPGVSGDICSLCCGTEREVTVNCPLDCEYLREARTHEKRAELDPKGLPNADIDLPERFLRQHSQLMMYTGAMLRTSIAKAKDAVDRDVREALDNLTRTYRTLSSGLYYESRSSNPYANEIQDSLQAAIAEYRKAAGQPGTAVRDAEILGILVMFQRLSLTYDNGRPKGRWFIDFLAHEFPAPEQVEKPADAPLIEL